MSPGMLCGLSDLTDGCKKYWPVCSLAGGVVCVYIGRCVVGHVRRNQVQRKIHERGQRSTKEIQSMQDKIKEENVNTKIVELPFNELQIRLQNGTLSAEEAWRSFLAKSLDVHNKTNAITDLIPSGKDEALALDKKTPSERGLLHGIPISVKESLGIKGMDCTAGIAALADRVRTEDSILIQTLKSQGALPFIKTNLSQATCSIACDNPIFGLTVHPQDPKRSTGGSSGGEGAVIGGGGSILGIGTDIGGSIRIPSAFCGIAGLKPTRGRYSFRGSYETGQPVDGENIIGITEGPMGRDVHALAQFMRAALSPKMFQLDPTIPPIPFREEIFKSKKSLRIGFYTYDGFSHCVPAVVRAVNVAKETLESLGHTVVPYEPYKYMEGFKECFWPAVLGDDFTSYANLLKYDDTCDAVYGGVEFNQKPYVLRWLHGKLRELTTYDPVGNAFLMRKSIRTVSDWWNLNVEKNNYIADFLGDWRHHGIDVMLCPVTPCPALTVGLDRNILAYVTYTFIYNLVNLPAGTVPVSHVTDDDVAKTNDQSHFKPETTFEKIIAEDSKNSEGLPVGVQIIGLPFEEETVLRVMAELENSLKLKQ